jgi:hypothetical protein
MSGGPGPERVGRLRGEAGTRTPALHAAPVRSAGVWSAFSCQSHRSVKMMIYTHFLNRGGFGSKALSINSDILVSSPGLLCVPAC